MRTFLECPACGARWDGLDDDGQPCRECERGRLSCHGCGLDLDCPCKQPPVPRVRGLLVEITCEAEDVARVLEVARDCAGRPSASRVTEETERWSRVTLYYRTSTCCPEEYASEPVRPDCSWADDLAVSLEDVAKVPSAVVEDVQVWVAMSRRAGAGLRVPDAEIHASEAIVALYHRPDGEGGTWRPRAGARPDYVGPASGLLDEDASILASDALSQGGIAEASGWLVVVGAQVGGERLEGLVPCRDCGEWVGSTPGPADRLWHVDTCSGCFLACQEGPRPVSGGAQ